MNLKEQLKLRGIKVADLAKEIGESYGNTYTALKIEAAGADIRHASVKGRLEKIRDYLGAEQQHEERMAETSGGKNVHLDARQRARPVPDGLVGIYEIDRGGVTVQVGSKVLLSEHFATEHLPAGLYIFLRATADKDGYLVDVDLYGGPGSGEKWFARHRTLIPSACGFPETVALPSEQQEEQ